MEVFYKDAYDEETVQTEIIYHSSCRGSQNHGVMESLRSLLHIRKDHIQPDSDCSSELHFPYHQLPPSRPVSHKKDLLQLPGHLVYILGFSLSTYIVILPIS